MKPDHFRVFLLPGVILLAGCVSRPAMSDHQAGRFLHDDAFPASSSYTVESANDVFLLDDDATLYVDSVIGRRQDLDRSRALLREIRDLLRNVSYESGTTGTASETFRNRNGNCLSLSILAYAMAKHLGYHGQFQEFRQPEYWERRGGRNVVTRHVNVRLLPETTPDGLDFSHSISIDFIPPAVVARLSSRPVTASHILAMFYNNRAVDALYAGELDVAYAYLRAALVAEPSLDMTLGNLGLLYLQAGHLAWSEEAYRAALRLDAANTVSAEGLAAVLKMSGQSRQAREVLEGVEARRRDNPYYQYVQGETAYEHGDYREAIRRFEQATRLGLDTDRPYFGLARAYSMLGDEHEAELYLRQAERRARDDELKQRYREKIAALSSL